MDQIEKGANKNFFSVQRWVDISNLDYGVTWVTPDAPMLQFDPIKIAQPFGIEYFRTFIDPGAYFHSWVMNNHWETNYKAYQEGEIRFRYVFQPYSGPYDPVKAQHFGRDICQPLIALNGDPSAAFLGAPLRVEGEGIVVTSIRPSRDGNALMVRLFNVADTRQTAVLNWNRQVGTTYISNPMEKILKPAPKQIEMDRFEVVTLKVEQE
jgi:alpha-mannosidase